MPRMTWKFSTALKLAHRLELDINDADRELIYQQLEEEGWHWNSQTSEWEQWADEPADEPTDLIMIRLWCASEVIAELAGDVIRQMKNIGLRLVEASPPYPCRPPKQQESRVYLKFFPERKLK
jgi:hypothetical protein